jgi:tripeptide aminopeptidase
MDRDYAHLLDRLPEFQAGARDLSEILLTNLVMISEIPAPTFGEQRRTGFLLDRFNEYELQNCSSDEAGNALGILPGTTGEQNILVVAHTDTAFPEKVDHTVSIEPTHVSGAGIGDDSLGLAAIATLPQLLQHLDIELSSNVIFMGSTRSLGHGDIEGIRFFLDNRNVPISSGICVEGVKLGRLSYASIGMLRGEINYRVPEEYDWTRFGAGGAIVNITDVINHILEIPLPRRPRTSIVLNSVEAGASFTPFRARRRCNLRFAASPARSSVPWVTRSAISAPRRVLRRVPRSSSTFWPDANLEVSGFPIPSRLTRGRSSRPSVSIRESPRVLPSSRRSSTRRSPRSRSG